MTFSAVSDTRCSTYLIFTAFLTAEMVEILNALSCVAYWETLSIFSPSVGLLWLPNKGQLSEQPFNAEGREAVGNPAR